jgi:hypothetical protein
MFCANILRAMTGKDILSSIESFMKKCDLNWQTLDAGDASLMN